MDSILGLELTENTLNILEVKDTKQGLQVASVKKLDLPTNSTKDGVILQPKLVAAKISSFLKENDIAAKKAVALINSTYAPTKIIRLPYNLTDDQIRLNLEAEVSQYQGLVGKEPVIDFNKLEEISEEGIKKINVIFTATSKALISSYSRMSRLAGLDLIDLDVAIMCLFRALDETELKSSSLEVNLLMLISDKHLEICIVKGNRPRFLHSVEMEILDTDKGLFSFIKRLLSTIKLVLNFYQVRFMQGEEITRIIVNPLDAKYSRIHLLLQEELPYIPIKLSDPLDKVSVDIEKVTDTEDLKFPFSCLLGATLRLKGKESPLDLNLLLREKAERKNRLSQLYIFLLASLSVFIVVAVSIGWIVLNINILEKKIISLDAKLQHSPAELNEIISVKAKREALKKKIQEAAIVTSGTEKHFLEDIAKAMASVTDSLWLTDISFDASNKSIVLNGESTLEKPIFDYVSILSQSRHFSAVELISSKGQEQSIKFVINCNVQ